MGIKGRSDDRKVLENCPLSSEEDNINRGKKNLFFHTKRNRLGKDRYLKGEVNHGSKKRKEGPSRGNGVKKR